MSRVRRRNRDFADRDTINDMQVALNAAHRTADRADLHVVATMLEVSAARILDAIQEPHIIRVKAKIE